MIRRELFGGAVLLGISTLGDGNMRAFSDAEFGSVLANQQKLIEAIGANAAARVLTTYVNRVAFTEYYSVDSDSNAKHSIEKPEARLQLADGLVTKDVSLALLLPLADCLGVVVYDAEQKILGLLHSGRQNLEEDGAYKFIEYLKAKFACEPKNLRVYFSPHAQSFKIFALNNAGLSEAAEEQLLRAGIKSEQIERSSVDTVTDINYPSNSAGDKTTRFAIAVRLNPQAN